MGKKTATKAKLTQCLDVDIRAGEIVENLEFKFLSKGVNKDVYQGG